MNTDDELQWDLARGWLEKAEEDMTAARVLLEGLPGPFNAVAFHAEQAAEKLLKALLVYHRIDIPRTHDLSYLLELVADVEPDIAHRARPARDLTPHAVLHRYPGDYEPTDRDSAEHLLSLAQLVGSLVTERLSSYLDGTAL